MMMVYVTYPDEAVAKDVSKQLIEGRLAACANIFQPHQSMYAWDGAVREEAEIAVIYKVLDDGFEALKDKILALHPYDVPCVVAWAIEKGHQPFLDWVGAKA